jgi:hypothetical protein
MYILLRKLLEGFIPDKSFERRDNIYENLRLINSERIFRYMLLFIVIIFIVHSLQIGVKHIFGIIISIITLYIYIQKDTQDQLDTDEEYKLKYNFLDQFLFVDKPFIVYDGNEESNLYVAQSEHPVSYLLESRILVNYLYMIRDYATIHPPAFNALLHNVNNLLKNRIQLEKGLVNCAQTIDIVVDEQKEALNNFQSIIYRLPSTDYSNKRYESDFKLLSEILEAEVDHMRNICRIDQGEEVINNLDRPHGVDYGPSANPVRSVDYSDHFNFV